MTNTQHTTNACSVIYTQNLCKVLEIFYYMSSLFLRDMFLIYFQVGNSALKKLHEILSLEDVERIMDEAREGIEVQQEIDALLAGGLSQDEEDDVAAELEEILAQSDTTKDLKLPDVPTNDLEEVRKTEKKRGTETQKVAVAES